MKKIVSFLLLAVVLAGCDPVFAADQVTAPAATVSVSAPAAPAPVAMPATVVTAPQAAMPTWQPLPAQHDVGPILAWVFAFLIPCLGWLASEIMPFLPGKANGLLHGAIEMLRAPAYDPATDTVTVQLGEIKSAITELKSAASGTNTPGSLT